MRIADARCIAGEEASPWFLIPGQVRNPIRAGIRSCDTEGPSIPAKSRKDFFQSFRGHRDGGAEFLGEERHLELLHHPPEFLS